jgi:hypothetical protein
MVGLTVAAVLAVAAMRPAHLELLILAVAVVAAYRQAQELVDQASPLFGILILLLRQLQLQGHPQLQ